MAKIAVIIIEMFEEFEYIMQAEAFTKSGHELIYVGLEEGKIIKGKVKGIPIKIDKAVKDVSVDDFDALWIPSGHFSNKLKVDEDAVLFVKGFLESDKPCFFKTPYPSQKSN